MNTATYDRAVFSSCDSNVGNLVHRGKSIYSMVRLLGLNGGTSTPNLWNLCQVPEPLQSSFLPYVKWEL